MLTFTSERQLARSALAIIAGLVASGYGFRLLQNQFGVIGGVISLPKLVWLGLALLFWLALPVLIVADVRTPPKIRRAFAWLLALMGARAAIEFVMLYITKNWSPLYGMGHDVICLCALIVCLSRAWLAGEPGSGPVARTLFVHGIVTSLMFIPEIWFAWYMHANFNTQGGQAIYFVPDTELHRQVLRVTSWVVLALIAYLPLFLGYWLHAPARRHSS
jgi:hypothetical protein